VSEDNTGCEEKPAVEWKRKSQSGCGALRMQREPCQRYLEAVSGEGCSWGEMHENGSAAKQRETHGGAASTSEGLARGQDP
jgi:hypothetical protein